MPVNVTAAPITAGAPTGAEKTVCCGRPGATVTLPRPETPVGSPVIWIVICALKPLTAIADNVTDVDSPSTIDEALGLTANAKSGVPL